MDSYICFLLMANVEYRFKNIMLVDDNEIDNFINKEVIARSQFSKEITVNSSVDLALNAIRNSSHLDKPGLLPEVIFVDLDMPVKDGFEFIREFMLLSKEVTRLSKLVVLTSSVDPLHETKALELCNDIKFLQKPLTSKKLQEL